MKKLLYSILALILAGILFYACQENINEPTPKSENMRLFALGDDPDVYPLYAGQSILVGEVQVWNDADLENLFVRFVITDPDWCLEETHVAVAKSLDGIPQKNGNPRPGQFPYKHEELGCSADDPYTIPLVDIEPNCDDELYIATHAVVQKQNVECIDFESYSEKEAVNTVSTSVGDVNFYMIKKLDDLAVGDIAEFKLPDSEDDYYPIVATPQTTGGLSENYDNIVAFTVKGEYANDDLVYFENGTGAGGNTLTDPQDLTQTKLMQHAYHKGLAIVIDVSEIDNYESINFAAVDLDHGELWRFQYFNSAGELLEVQTLNGPDQSGDGKAFPISNANPNVAAIVIWGGMNNGNSEVVGYAFDNFCITTIEEETAWGDGPGFPGRNWATYFNYVVTCEPPEPPPGCETETAWGGNSAGGGSAWWYYFDTQGSATQTIYAGKNATDGTVTYDAGTLTINLGSWELQADDEAVKVEGYDVIPSVRPPAGLFTLYKGTALTVTGDGSRYYAIHLDVQLCE